MLISHVRMLEHQSKFYYCNSFKANLASMIALTLKEPHPNSSSPKPRSWTWWNVHDFCNIMFSIIIQLSLIKTPTNSRSQLHHQTLICNVKYAIRLGMLTNTSSCMIYYKEILMIHILSWLMPPLIPQHLLIAHTSGCLDSGAIHQLTSNIAHFNMLNLTYDTMYS